MIIWSGPSCLPTFITELSALDGISALEIKLEKVDPVISEIHSITEAEDNFSEEAGLPVF